MEVRKTRGAWEIAVRGNSSNHDAKAMDSQCKPICRKPYPKQDKQNTSEGEDE